MKSRKPLTIVATVLSALVFAYWMWPLVSGQVVEEFRSRVGMYLLIWMGVSLAIVWGLYFAAIYTFGWVERRGEQDSKVCEMGVIGLLLGLAGILCVFATAPLAFVLGVASVFRIQRSKGKLRGAIFAVLAIVIGQAGTIWMYYVGIPRIRSIAPRMVCGTNLSGLGKAILLYSNDNNGEYPTPEVWCDLLLEHGEVTKKMFRCRGNEEQACAYAINPNCDLKSPPDTVLVFDATTTFENDGWNRFGGAELLSVANHKGDGCNILFNDGHVMFIKATPDALCDLNWGDEGED